MAKITTVDFKNHRKADKIKNELTQVSNIIAVNIQALFKYKHYKAVDEILNLLYNNKKTVDLNIQKCEEILQKKEYESKEK